VDVDAQLAPGEIICPWRVFVDVDPRHMTDDARVLQRLLARDLARIAARESVKDILFHGSPCSMRLSLAPPPRLAGDLFLYGLDQHLAHAPGARSGAHRASSPMRAVAHADRPRQARARTSVPPPGWGRSSPSRRKAKPDSLTRSRRSRSGCLRPSRPPDATAQTHAFPWVGLLAQKRQEVRHVLGNEL
jgi:hypothetical protein